MFSTLISLVMENLLYFALHVEGNGTFPKPLTLKQEKESFELMKQGDSAARDRLIEHNLRLVAHIAKKYYSDVYKRQRLESRRNSCSGW